MKCALYSNDPYKYNALAKVAPISATKFESSDRRYYSAFKVYQKVAAYIELTNRFLVINPRRACAARVTVVVLCVCMYVCMYVCVSTPTCRLTHWNHKREIPTDSAQHRDRFNFFLPIFLKMLRSKVMA